MPAGPRIQHIHPLQRPPAHAQKEVGKLARSRAQVFRLQRWLDIRTDVQRGSRISQQASDVAVQLFVAGKQYRRLSFLCQQEARNPGWLQHLLNGPRCASVRSAGDQDYIRLQANQRINALIGLAQVVESRNVHNPAVARLGQPAGAFNGNVCQ